MTTSIVVPMATPLHMKAEAGKKKSNTFKHLAISSLFVSGFISTLIQSHCQRPNTFGVRDPLRTPYLRRGTTEMFCQVEPRLSHF